MRAFILSVLILYGVSCNEKETDVTATPTGCVAGGGVNDIDGNHYQTVVIGTQEWMAENLKTTRYRNGDAVQNVTGAAQWASASTGAYCYYNNDAANNGVYGKLYNWLCIGDARGIAPTGWHVPTETELETLFTNLGGSSVAGSKMKEVGVSHWFTDNYNTTNSTCFTGLPGGFRNNDINALFNNLTMHGTWWLSSEATPTTSSYSFTLSHSSPVCSKGSAPKNIGYSIRCIKD